MESLIKPFLVFIVFLLFSSLFGFYFAIRPFRIISSINPQSFHLAYENVTFLTDDNISLRGWFIPNKNPRAKTIILLHGYPADKGNILPSMLFLHAYYHLFLFDFRYFGESGGHFSTIGKYEVSDLLAAIKYLNSRGVNEIGVWGFSMGGAVALMAAPKAHQIKAIVAESSYANLNAILSDYYRIPLLKYPLAWLTRLWAYVFLKIDIKKVAPSDAISKITIPILIIHSKDDNVIPFDQALMLKKASSHNANTQFIFVDQLSHGIPIAQHEQIILKFFTTNLK